MNGIVTLVLFTFLSAGITESVRANQDENAALRTTQGLKNARRVMRSTIERYHVVTELKKKAKSKARQTRERSARVSGSQQ